MRRARTIFSRLFLLTGLAVVAVPAGAADGRIPIHTLPVTIAESGSYYVTRNLTFDGPGVAIDIQADDVTLDFNGHTLDNSYQGEYTIQAIDRTNIRIHNGNVRGGNIGIYLKNTVTSDFTVRVHDMHVTGALNQGIYILGQSLIGSSRAYVERNVLHRNGDDGIYIRFVWGGRVAGNVVSDNTNGSAGAHGIYAHSCRGVQIADNAISNFSGDAVRLWYSWYMAVDDNLLTYSSGMGLDIYQGDQIVFRNNRAYGNGGGGFDIPGGEGHVNAGGNYPAP